VRLGAEPRLMDPTSHAGPNPVVGDGAVVVLGADDVSAYSLTDGARTWRVAAGGAICAVSSGIADGIVVVMTGTGTLCDTVRALEVADGSTAWERPIPPAALGDTVTVGDGVVTVIPSCDGFVRLASDTGRVLSTVRGACAATDGTTLVTADRTHLAAYDVRTGARRTALTTPPFWLDDVLSSDPLVVTGKLGSRTVAATVADSGLTPRGETGADLQNPITTQVRVGETVWADAGTALVGLTVSGAWAQTPLPLGTTRSFAGRSGDRLLVVSPDDGERSSLLAYDTTGHPRRVATLATPVPTRAAVAAGDRLVVLTSSGLAAYPLP
jgi:hypothetical protein